MGSVAKSTPDDIQQAAVGVACLQQQQEPGGSGSSRHQRQTTEQCIVLQQLTANDVAQLHSGEQGDVQPVRAGCKLLFGMPHVLMFSRDQ